MMYKILKPLGGYGYLVDDITDKIADADIPKFLKNKSIEEVTPDESKKTKPVGKKDSDKK